MEKLATQVAAVIPAYQAASMVGPVVARTREILPWVVVVDDGSTDATGEAAEAAGAEVLTLPENRGKGAALKAGFDRVFGAGAERAVTLDADGQHLPEEIPKLLEPVGRADLVLGVRDHLFDHMSELRRNSNTLSSRLITGCVGLPYMDVQTGFRLYERRLIEAVGFPEPGFEAETAVVVRAARAGFRMVTTPVDLGEVDGRGTSHFRPLWDGVRIFIAVCRARFGKRTW